MKEEVVKAVVQDLTNLDLSPGLNTNVDCLMFTNSPQESEGNPDWFIAWHADEDCWVAAFVSWRELDDSGAETLYEHRAYRYDKDTKKWTEVEFIGW